MKNLLSLIAVILIFSAAGKSFGETITIDNDIQTYTSLADTTVNITGTSELHLSGSSSVLDNCQINLNSAEAWLFFSSLKPSEVNSSVYLSQIYVNGSQSALNSNIRIVRYHNGAVVIPHGEDYEPLKVYSGINFTGSSQRFGLHTYYKTEQLGAMNDSIRSFTLKRGYMATFAENSDGTGISRVYIADDKKLKIGVMPADLDKSVSFVRVFPWHWTTKKGWAGGTPSNVSGSASEALNCSWRYNWGNGGETTLDVEYVPMRHGPTWPSYSVTNAKENVTHVLGFNEPDRPDQADMSVSEAIDRWPNLLESGLRLGSPSPSDGGLNWLYDFIDQADALNYRVDFVPVHFYKNNWSASQMYNWLKAVHERTKRPLWITEWNNGCNWTTPHPTYQQNGDKIAELLSMLSTASFVERYSIYQWCTNREMFYDDGWLTPAGNAYKDHVSFPAISLDQNKECIGFYKLDAPNGTSAVDLSGKQMDAGLKNGLSFDNDSVQGMRGYALSLDGDEYIELPEGYDEFDNGFSASFWVYPTAVKSYARFFDLGNGPNGDNIVAARYSDTDDLYFQVYNNATGGSMVRASNAIELNKWQFFSVTVDSIGNVKIYKDSQLIKTGTATPPRSVLRSSNFIGRSNWSSDGYYEGRIDDIRLFDYALTGNEIDTLFNISMTSEPYDGTPADIPGQISAERFDLGGQGIAYHDSTIGNEQEAFRLGEDVDIRGVFDYFNSFAVTDIGPDEWLNYTVNIPDSDNYCMYLRASTTLSETPVVIKHFTYPSFDAAGVYDEQNVQTNQVDYSMSYSSNSSWTTGIGQTLGASQVMTYEEFKPWVEEKYLSGNGGVLNFDNNELNNSESFTAVFAGGQKQFSVTATGSSGASSFVNNTASGGGRTPISGDKRLQGNTNRYEFEFSDFVGMEPQDLIAAGITILGRDGSSDGWWRVIAYYTNGEDSGSTSTSRYIDMTSGNTTYDSFSGIAAPDGYWITKLRVHCDNSWIWSAVDDLAFVLENQAQSSSVMALSSLEEQMLAEFTVSSTGSSDNFKTFVLNDVILPAAGSKVLRMEFPFGGLDVNWLRIEKEGHWGQTPPTIPGRIQAEEYDFGGAGKAYYDTSSDNGIGDFRYYENVDVADIGESGSEYAVGGIEAGEWLSYTVNSIEGTADVYAKAASVQSGGQILVRIDDELSAVIDVPNTGGLTNWQIIPALCEPLPEKQNASVELEFAGEGFQLDWLQFAKQVPYPENVPHSIPGQIEFENFDTGGQEISFFDTTPTNTYGGYRPDEAVEIAAVNEGFAVYTEAGEWLEYTVDLAGGNYDLSILSAGPYSGQQLTLSLDGNHIVSADLNTTGSWSDWQTTVIPDLVLPDGQGQVLRMELDSSSVFLDNMSFIRHYNPADIDQSTKVDLEDFSILSDQWLVAPAEPSADIAGPPNNQVGIDDLLILLENWLVEE
ncbi:glycosyl hydrolase [Sedimentisphaera salicampi]|uniref:glycosyl hydrolase n=1 Tax=Sedimentisphaera salicampi TaxID=1941349 RepID=UPI000B9BE609|nr:glycosyl hydrolase [Sedimentisphaera salicampi]OXU15551.1 Glycosyl hydrolase catalytic core [Sedimentisphaera salicampi]